MYIFILCFYGDIVDQAMSKQRKYKNMFILPDKILQQCILIEELPPCSKLIYTKRFLSIKHKEKQFWLIKVCSIHYSMEKTSTDHVRKTNKKVSVDVCNAYKTTKESWIILLLYEVYYKNTNGNESRLIVIFSFNSLINIEMNTERHC